MNKLPDQQLQEFLENKQHNVTTKTPLNVSTDDIQLYNRLFDELATEPADTFLSYSFSANVTHLIGRQIIDRNERNALILYGVSVLLTVCVVCLILFAFQVKVLTLLGHSLSLFAIPMMVAAVAIGFIQWADYRLLKRVK